MFARGHRGPNAAGPAVAVGPSCMLVFLIFSALERGGPTSCSRPALPQASFATWQHSNHISLHHVPSPRC